MRVGRNTICAGVPMIACGPNSASESMAASNAPPVIAGATRGKLMRSAVCQRLAPSICADSSSDASTDFSAL